MESDPQDWQRLRRPGFQVDLSYPTVTPQGQPVERTEEQVEDHPLAGGFERVHLTSPDRRELYVEVARFPDLTPRDEYLRHKPYLEKRFGADSLTALSETTVRDRPAWSYSFRWEDGERSVLLLQVAGDTYRVIYDPRSALNARVIDTLTLVE